MTTNHRRRCHTDVIVAVATVIVTLKLLAPIVYSMWGPIHVLMTTLHG